jgi:hypothetical protein
MGAFEPQIWPKMMGLQDLTLSQGHLSNTLVYWVPLDTAIISGI